MNKIFKMSWKVETRKKTTNWLKRTEKVTVYTWKVGGSSRNQFLSRICEILKT